MSDNLFYGWKHHLYLFGLGSNVKFWDYQIWGLALFVQKMQIMGMVSNCIIWWRTKKIRPHGKNRVTHTILDIRPEFFCPPPYYAVWNHPHLIILSAFSFSQSFNFSNVFSTKVLNEIKIFFGRLVPKNK